MTLQLRAEDMAGQIDQQSIAYLLFDAPDRVCGDILFGGENMIFKQEQIDQKTKKQRQISKVVNKNYQRSMNVRKISYFLSELQPV